MGSSGSGKSTLLKILGGLEKPTSGTVCINGANMADYGQQDYDRHRQMTVGYVFQEFNLLEGLTLKENRKVNVAGLAVGLVGGDLDIFYHFE